MVSPESPTRRATLLVALRRVPVPSWHLAVDATGCEVDHRAGSDRRRFEAERDPPARSGSVAKSAPPKSSERRRGVNTASAAATSPDVLRLRELLRSNAPPGERFTYPSARSSNIRARAEARSCSHSCPPARGSRTDPSALRAPCSTHLPWYLVVPPDNRRRPRSKASSTSPCRSARSRSPPRGNIRPDSPRRSGTGSKVRRLRGMSLRAASTLGPRCQPPSHNARRGCNCDPSCTRPRRSSRLLQRRPR